LALGLRSNVRLQSLQVRSVDVLRRDEPIQIPDFVHDAWAEQVVLADEIDVYVPPLEDFLTVFRADKSVPISAHSLPRRTERHRIVLELNFSHVRL